MRGRWRVAGSGGGARSSVVAPFMAGWRGWVGLFVCLVVGGVRH